MPSCELRRLGPFSVTPRHGDVMTQNYDVVMAPAPTRTLNSPVRFNLKEAHHIFAAAVARWVSRSPEDVASGPLVHHTFAETLQMARQLVAEDVEPRWSSAAAGLCVGAGLWGVGLAASGVGCGLAGTTARNLACTQCVGQAAALAQAPSVRKAVEAGISTAVGKLQACFEDTGVVEALSCATIKSRSRNCSAAIFSSHGHGGENCEQNMQNDEGYELPHEPTMPMGQSSTSCNSDYEPLSKGIAESQSVKQSVQGDTFASVTQEIDEPEGEFDADHDAYETKGSDDGAEYEMHGYAHPKLMLKGAGGTRARIADLRIKEETSPSFKKVHNVEVSRDSALSWTSRCHGGSARRIDNCSSSKVGLPVHGFL
eukprot:TRINITY_DN26680_c0_g1_i1.p1 TRINITY_DN26680_c0_g1~~TRINITY_DN26680_c0_g1_i1.p1  ORF type:complete len:370 (+),score=55.14 TRINITY_DN26680_c0_g1_i1:236-1345(+)